MADEVESWWMDSETHLDIKAWTKWEHGFMLKVQRTAVLRVSSQKYLSKKFEVNLSKYEVSEPSQIKEKYQMSWNLRTYGRWTTRLIPVIKSWKKRKHGYINYKHMVQNSGVEKEICMSYILRTSSINCNGKVPTYRFGSRRGVENI